MITKRLTPEEQSLIVECLYHSTDSISSAKRFNLDYGNNLGHPIGTLNVDFNEFVRMLFKTPFNHLEIEKALKKITGIDIDIGQFA